MNSMWARIRGMRRIRHRVKWGGRRGVGGVYLEYNCLNSRAICKSYYLVHVHATEK